MANEIKIAYGQSGKVLYFQVRNQAGQIWNTSAAAFQAYATASIGDYDVSMTEQGSASGFYVGTFPAGITTNALYAIAAFQQMGGSPAETDPPVGQGNFAWNGSAELSFADNPASGFFNQSVKIPRGTMVRNFPFSLVSQADGFSPLTSGSISGQISRDGGSFGVLQSGAFTEIGQGCYSLQALTSGDLLANTVLLRFTGVNLSGGTAIPRVFSILTQPSSGQ
jgi:hypothetical protein